MTTFWGVFTYASIPAGFVVLLLLLSDITLLMKVASKALRAPLPLTLGNLQLNIAVLMTVFCGLLTVITYANTQRAEMKTKKIGALERETSNLFYVERNFWLSVLALTLWVTSWRLEVLFRQRPVRPAFALNLRPSKGLYMAIGIAALLLADLPLCRLNYQFQIQSYVSPGKARLQASDAAAQCSNIYASSADGSCRTFCDEVRLLSEERLSSVMFARKWHVLGRWAAEVFDMARDVQQGPSHVNQLFEKKTCADVLKSVDKSNDMVNAFCLVLAAVAVVVAFAAFSKVFGDMTETNLHTD
ncbi:unnamed protein product [Symbiodinium pilosum]|uniref:Uncharacterized protein n=1 Tax=Symbiodinium pilosum TaxID=2952 RepID=A0A812WFQ3_SYMPI|nr:unnamed protein product [Symbiodinium pilosum]